MELNLILTAYLRKKFNEFNNQGCGEQPLIYFSNKNLDIKY